MDREPDYFPRTGEFRTRGHRYMVRGEKSKGGLKGEFFT